MPNRLNADPKNDPVSNWDSGWFIFEDGHVVGPMTATEAFSPVSQDRQLQPRMVSRKGFSQWYPIQDFVAIHTMASRYVDFLNQVDSKTTATNKFETKEVQVTPKAIGQKIGPKLKNEATIPLSSPLETIKTAQKELVTPYDSPSEAVIFSGNRPEPVKQTPQQTNIQTFSFDQQYLQVASRLRLGKISNSWLGAVILIPLTLGGYWWAWFARVSEEVSWHLNGASRMNFIVPIWMCMIPGVHLILAYLVARMTSQIELQNGYKTINPALATLCAIFPPFYLLMIQGALNRHWRLHVYHSAASAIRNSPKAATSQYKTR